MDQTKKDTRNHIEKERIRRKAPSYAMIARNQGILSQNVQILINQLTRRSTSNQRTRKY